MITTESSSKERLEWLKGQIDRHIAGKAAAQTKPATAVGSTEMVCVEKLRTENELLKQLLDEARGLLVSHHGYSMIADVKMWGARCPICSHGGKQNYPNDIFGRIESALDKETHTVEVSELRESR